MSQPIPGFDSPTAPKNTLALVALILGIIALLLGIFLIGILPGLAAVILGIVALKNRSRRGMAIGGIITGAISLPLFIVGLLLVILLPALTNARARATETRAASHLRSIDTSLMIYSTDWGDHLPKRLSQIQVYCHDPSIFSDPRLTATPPTVWPATPDQVDAMSDFYYAYAGDRMTRIRQPSQVILLYDHPGASHRRVIAFADGHVEMLPENSPELDAVVRATNDFRATLGLPPLPARLQGSPPPLTSASPERP